MSRIAIVNGNVLTPTYRLERGVVLVEGNKIAAVARGPALAIPADAQIIEAQGLTVCPGFIDVHVHGGAGHDTMDATPEALTGMSAFFARHGVTGFLPTTVTASREATLAAIRAVADHQQAKPAGAQALGVHLEGPFISAERPGAQNPRFIRSPDPEEYEALFALGNVKLISLAPEAPGAEALIAYALSRGATVAVGHSSASYEQVLAAVRLGLNHAAHTYNTMQGLHHRQPGTAGAALTCDEIYAEIIVDLVHVHPAMVKLLVRAKGLDRALLVTDAICAAGMPDGTYELGGQEIIVTEGEARLPSGNLAGSTLTMEHAVRNVMQAAGLSWAEAIRLATLTPAKSIGMDHRKGRLSPGYDADITLLDEHLEVVLTMVAGRVIYQR